MQQCSKFAEWKWSSHRALAFGEENPIIDFHELYLYLGKSTKERQEIYREMVEDCIREKGLRREPVFSSGIILGSKSFVEGLLVLCSQTYDFYRNRQAHSYQEDTYSLRQFLPLPDTS